jgi:hypothetical protein
VEERDGDFLIDGVVFDHQHAEAGEAGGRGWGRSLRVAERGRVWQEP